jgi:membrane dipeptidase
MKVAGINLVELGADMYPRTPSLVGIRGVQDYPNITRGHLNRGDSPQDVEMFMGGNFLRVWKRVAG